MQIIEINDFSGGKNLYHEKFLVEDNQCVSTATRNVWAVGRSLSKIPGYTQYANMTATGNAFLGMGNAALFYDSTVNTAFDFYGSLQAPKNGFSQPWAGTGGILTTPLGYTTGTIAIGSVSATGSGTTWATNVSGGDTFQIAGVYYNILSVEDSTHATIATAVTVGAGTSYKAIPSRPHCLSVATLNGQIAWTTTGDNMVLYDGTGTLRNTAAPKAAYLETFKGYMFAARTSTATSRLYWSAANDPTSWPTNNFIDIDKGRGFITGIRKYGNELIVFKSNGMYKVVGDIFDPSNPTYAVYPIAVPPYFRFNSVASAVVHNDVLMFYALGEIYSYLQGTFHIKKISSLIEPDLPKTFGNINLETSIDQNIAAISMAGYYFIQGLDYSSSLNPEFRSFVMDRGGAWWQYADTTAQNGGAGNNAAGWGPCALMSYPTTTAKPVLLSAPATPTPARLFAFDPWTPNYESAVVLSTIDRTTGANREIDASWRSKSFDIDYGTIKYAVLYLGSYSPSGTITFDYSIDDAAYVSQSINVATGRGTILRKVIPINQNGTTIQLRIIEAGTSTFSGLIVYKIQIFYEPNPANRFA